MERWHAEKHSIRNEIKKSENIVASRESLRNFQIGDLRACWNNTIRISSLWLCHAVRSCSPSILPDWFFIMLPKINIHDIGTAEHRKHRSDRFQHGRKGNLRRCLEIFPWSYTIYFQTSLIFVVLETIRWSMKTPYLVDLWVILPTFSSGIYANESQYKYKFHKKYFISIIS